MRRRGLGVITGPNPANLTQDQLAALTPDQLQMYQSVGWYTPTMAQLTASAFTAQQIAAQNQQEQTAAVPAPAPAPAPQPIARVVAPAQPVWGAAPRVVPFSVPVLAPTSVQSTAPAGSAPTSFLSTTLLGFPLWIWAAAAVGGYFLFSGGGHGR